jgi:hypothetical protein
LIQRKEFYDLQGRKNLVVHLVFPNLQRGKGEVVKGENLLTTEVLQGNTSAGRQNKKLNTLESVLRETRTPECFLKQLVQRSVAIGCHILFLHQRIIGSVKDRQRKSIREKSDG